MLAAGSEQNGDEESHDGAETYPPGEFHYGQPGGLGINFAAEDSSNVVRQTAQNRDDDETDNHRDDDCRNRYRAIWLTCRRGKCPAPSRMYNRKC